MISAASLVYREISYMALNISTQLNLVTFPDIL